MGGGGAVNTSDTDPSPGMWIVSLKGCPAVSQSDLSLALAYTSNQADLMCPTSPLLITLLTAASEESLCRLLLQANTALPLGLLHCEKLEELVWNKGPFSLHSLCSQLVAPVLSWCLMKTAFDFLDFVFHETPMSNFTAVLCSSPFDTTWNLGLHLYLDKKEKPVIRIWNNTALYCCIM